MRSLPLAARGSHRNGDVAAQGPGLPATAEADLQPDYGSQHYDSNIIDDLIENQEEEERRGGGGSSGGGREKDALQ